MGKCVSKQTSATTEPSASGATGATGSTNPKAKASIDSVKGSLDYQELRPNVKLKGEFGSTGERKAKILPAPLELNVRKGSKSGRRPSSRSSSSSESSDYLSYISIYDNVINHEKCDKLNYGHETIQYNENSANVEAENDRGLNNEGQSESKKSKKRGPETKGTAMSFGFRKKSHTTNTKSANNANIYSKDLEPKSAEIFETNENITLFETVTGNSEITTTEDLRLNDKNGNGNGNENTNGRNETKRDILRSTRRDAGGSEIGTAQPYKGSRFGFKSSNIVRPASTGLTPKMAHFQDNAENNNFIADKRRSKSASGAANSNRSVQSSNIRNNQFLARDQHPANEQKNSGTKIVSSVSNQQRHQEEKEKLPSSILASNATASFENSRQNDTNSDHCSRVSSQYTVINTGIHTNVIVRPTPQPAISVSRFTLHTKSLPKPQYPVPISLTKGSTNAIMDSKKAKQVANTSRKGFQGPRDISNDSGISSLDNNSIGHGYNSNLSPKRARNRPRNLEMIINERHKFEVRDMDDSLSTDSIVEPLSLPKLPSVFSSDIQTVPLSGLVRSKTSIQKNEEAHTTQNTTNSGMNREINNSITYSSDAESLGEEKLFRDRSTSEKHGKSGCLKDYATSSKNSSPESSRASWCNAGESLAVKDCSSLSLSSSDDIKDNQNEKTISDIPAEENTVSMSFSERPNNLLLSLTDSSNLNSSREHVQEEKRPETLSNIAETKFAEMAATVSDVLLDDETSPTDSLASSAESEGGAITKKIKKKRIENLQEKDIDEISPELEICSPLSPGTPTHASNSMSLSDEGRDFLIDDEIADQPALLFSDKADIIGSSQVPSHRSTDTPTLMDTISNMSSNQNKKSKLGAFVPSIENDVKRTPLSRKRISLLNRAESLDTLSPCESIASDDLMMDFESSSMDSIDRLSHSIRSQSGPVLKALDDAQLWSELENKSSEVMREWNNILKVHRNSKDSIFSQLPARATRLLNRSRLQQSQLSSAGSDSPKSVDSTSRKSLRGSSLQFNAREPNSSFDDLVFYDKTFRNSMIQDVLYFKKQLIRLRRILQETETLNPFDVGNGQFFASCGLDNSFQSEVDDKSGFSSATLFSQDDQKQELADLRRQVVYLQGQLNDRDRTIRLQRNLIEQFEADKERIQTVSVSTSISEKECVNSATQTERLRPLSIGQEGLARCKKDSMMMCSTNSPAINSATLTPVSKKRSLILSPLNSTGSLTSLSPIHTTSRRHTIISATLSNVDRCVSAKNSRRLSLDGEKLTYKPVKTTLIGEPVDNLNQYLINTQEQNKHSLENLSVKDSRHSKNIIKNSNNLHNSCNGNNDIQQQQQNQSFLQMLKNELHPKSDLSNSNGNHCENNNNSLNNKQSERHLHSNIILAENSVTDKNRSYTITIV